MYSLKIIIEKVRLRSNPVIKPGEYFFVTIVAMRCRKKEFIPIIPTKPRKIRLAKLPVCPKNKSIAVSKYPIVVIIRTAKINSFVVPDYGIFLPTETTSEATVLLLNFVK